MFTVIAERRAIKIVLLRRSLTGTMIVKSIIYTLQDTQEEYFIMKLALNDIMVVTETRMTKIILL